MESPSLSGLDVLARDHWNWISESFLHVSILREWGERTLSERISDQYSTEIPRAFRLVEFMLESNHRVSFSEGAENSAFPLPDPGRSVQAMAARELSRMQALGARLRLIREESAGESPVEVGEIVEEAISSQGGYMGWLEQRMKSLDDMGGMLCLDADDPSWSTLNGLLLQLLYGIDETSVHMLVLRHENQGDEAERSWQRSYGYMLLAFKIVRYFASRQWAIDFRSRATVEKVSSPRIGSTLQQVRQINQERYMSLKTWAEETIHFDQAASKSVQSDPKVEALMEQLASGLADLSGLERVPAPALVRMMERYRYPS